MPAGDAMTGPIRVLLVGTIALTPEAPRRPGQASTRSKPSCSTHGHSAQATISTLPDRSQPAQCQATPGHRAWLPSGSLQEVPVLRSDRQSRAQRADIQIVDTVHGPAPQWLRTCSPRSPPLPSMAGRWDLTCCRLDHLSRRSHGHSRLPRSGSAGSVRQQTQSRHRSRVRVERVPGADVQCVRTFSSGHVEQLLSGSFRVIVYAGTDPISGRPLRHREPAKTTPQAQILLRRLLERADAGDRQIPVRWSANS